MAIEDQNVPTGITSAQVPLIEAMILTCEGNTSAANAIIEAKKEKQKGKPFYDGFIAISERLADPNLNR